MDIDARWLTELGIEMQTGIDYTGSKDRFISALQRFYKSYDKNRAKVDEFFAKKDYENYMITVHALKSNAKMIGATALAIEFEKLENAARNNDTATIESNTAPTLEVYSSLVEKLSPIGEMGDVRAADEISAEEAIKIADELLAALDDFDDDLSKSLVAKLAGYPFRPTQKDMLKKAAAAVEDFMYDDAADLIRSIYPMIE